MSRAALVEQMRRRALVGAIKHCAEIARYRPPAAAGPCPWSAMRPSRQSSYEDGLKKFGKDLADALALRYPRAFGVADSAVWDCLEPERTDHWLRLRLHRSLSRGNHESDTEALIGQLAADPRVTGDELDQLGPLICALRLAMSSCNEKAFFLLALGIARRLLLLTGCPLRTAAAGEIWRQCDRFVRGMKRDSLYLRFAPNTWSWFAQHALSVRSTCSTMAFRNPYAGELPPEVMPAMLSDLASGIATLDLEETVRALSGFKSMSPLHRQIPDAETIGMWRVLPQKDEPDRSSWGR